MPLTRVRRPAIETPMGVHFGMMQMHEGTSVRVLLVTREVLQVIAERSADNTSLLPKFDLYRTQFEAIASDKFDRGDQGRPIKLTRADVIKFAADRRPDGSST
jgi:hypothetical protein